MCENTSESFVRFLLHAEFSSYICSFPSWKYFSACLHFFMRFSMKIRKYSLLFSTSRSLYLLQMPLRCVYVSGSISRRNGGEFFRFIFRCWQSLTTLSIMEYVLSMVRLCMTSLGGPILSTRTPWILLINEGFPLFPVSAIAERHSHNTTTHLHHHSTTAELAAPLSTAEILILKVFKFLVTYDRTP